MVILDISQVIFNTIAITNQRYTMATYLQATNATGVTRINAKAVSETADILCPTDFVNDVVTLADEETIYTYVYPDELALIDAEYGIQSS